MFVLHTRDCTSVNYIMLCGIELLKTHYYLNVLVFEFKQFVGKRATAHFFVFFLK
jgi:hypothetical protein